MAVLTSFSAVLKSEISPTKEIALEIADMAHQKAIKAALLDFGGKKKLKKPRYRKLPKSPAEKAATKAKALAKLPNPPSNVASEINKQSKLAKTSKITKANDGRSYVKISGKWYQLSEQLVEELNNQNG